MKITEIAKTNTYKTFSKVTYEKLPCTLEVDTIKINGVKTGQVKRYMKDNILRKLLIYVFDRNGKIIERHPINYSA